MSILNYLSLVKAKVIQSGAIRAVAEYGLGKTEYGYIFKIFRGYKGISDKTE